MRILAIVRTVPLSVLVALGAAVTCASPLVVAQESAPTPAPVIDEGPYIFEEVVAVEGVPASELYLRARLWAVNAFKSSNSAVEINDRDSAIVAGKGTVAFEPNFLIASVPLRGLIRFHFKVSAKEGRYKYTIGEFVHEGASLSAGTITKAMEAPAILKGPKSWRVKVWTQMQNLAEGTGLGLAFDLKAAMLVPSKGEADW